MQIGYSGACEILWEALHPIKELRYYFGERPIPSEGYCIWFEWDDTGNYPTRIQICGHICLRNYSSCCMCEIHKPGRRQRTSCVVCTKREKLAG